MRWLWCLPRVGVVYWGWGASEKAWWFSSVQSLSHVLLFATPWTATCQASLSITNSQSLLKLLSIESVIPSSYLILCHPLLLPSVFPSIRVFSSEPVLCIRWPKYWNFSFTISPSNEYSGLISLRMDWFDLLAVQGTLKSLLQHQSLKASTLQCSAFFMVQLSHPYMAIGKTIALTRWTFVGKVMSLLFIMLSRLVIARFIFGRNLLRLSHTCPVLVAGVHDMRVSIQLCSCFSESYPDNYFKVCIWWEETVWSDDSRKRALSQSWD